MKNITRIALLLLVASMLLSLFACGGGVENETKETVEEASTEQSASSESESATERDATDGSEAVSATETATEKTSEKATETAEARADRMIEEAQNRADSMIRVAQNEAQLERQKANEDIKRQIVEVSGALAEKMLEREINTEDHKALIDSFLDQIGENDDRDQ